MTYTTFQARDLGGDTAELFKTAAREAYERFQPEAMLVGASCTAELIQDDPGGLAAALGLPMPVVPLELPAYQRKENWGAAETFYQLVRAFAGLAGPAARAPARGAGCNILGPTALGFRHRDDVAEITRLLDALGIAINVVAPLGATPADLARLGDADFNVVLYPETAAGRRRWLERDVSASRYARPCRSASAPPATSSPRSPSSPASIRRRSRRKRLAPALVLALGRFDLPDRQARLHLRRRHPCHRRRPHRARRIGFTVVGLGIYTREFARDVRERRQALRHRGADHRRLPGGRGRHHRSRSRSWFSARRWSATSPSGWAFPAR